MAVVGRPNVGKSTLFNALAGEMISIGAGYTWYYQRPNLCRYYMADMAFTMIDTGGIEPDSKDIILSQMREQHRLLLIQRMLLFL